MTTNSLPHGLKLNKAKSHMVPHCTSDKYCWVVIYCTYGDIDIKSDHFYVFMQAFKICSVRTQLHAGNNTKANMT